MNILKRYTLSKLKGVGPKKLQLLQKINLNNMYDLLTYFPRNYEDMSTINLIENSIGEKGLFYLKVLSEPTIKRVRNLQIMSIDVSDGKSSAELVFFNQSFYKNLFRKGYKIYIYGTIVKKGIFTQVTNPRIIKNNEIGRYEPIYNLTNGITNNEIKRLLRLILNEYKHDIIDYLPEEIKDKFNLIDLLHALEYIHFPSNKEDILKARKRLAFDELFILQLSLEQHSFRSKKSDSPKFKINLFEEKILEFENNLEFKLTNAQKRVFNEIVNDVKEPNGMNRLVQGDVGSGKTVVASMCLYISQLNGYQSALMAPTEILAKQHFNTISNFFNNININIELLTGDNTLKEKELIYKDLENGKIDIIIGTHALIQEKVKFKKLGFTIIDEQHRFGVEQRKTLYEKGQHPHNLSMTATPIPRTLALIVYGDMDISIIDELPPGRQKIDTFVIDDSYINRMDKFLIDQIKMGRQAFVVCPLIEDNDMPLKSLEEIYEHYSSQYFKNNNIVTAYIHGKMKNEEKNKIMNYFLENKIQILVSTTVIEVGIDVPNANMMIIYDADRFGLSQLHQLRGRVGRGSEKSYCILFNNNKSELSYRRMKIMKQSSDGFYIAEKDLQLRGEGELLGTRQHGVANLKIVNLNNDIRLIEMVKSNFNKILESIKKDNKQYEELLNYIEFGACN